MTTERAGAVPAGPVTQETGATGVLRAVRAHPVLIALVTLAAVLAAALWVASRSPTYEATAEILVTPAADDGGPARSLPLLRTSGDRTRIVQTAASLVESAEAAQLSQSAIGGDWTAERIGEAVDVEPVGQSDVLAVTAVDGDPQVAARLANVYARAALEARTEALTPRVDALIEQLQDELRELPDPESSAAVELSEQLTELRAVRRSGDPTLSLSRGAQVPTSAVGTSSGLVLLLALLAGLIVGVGAALALDLVGPARVADADAASALANSPVLARVPGGGPSGTAAAALRTLQLQLDARRPPARAVLLASPSSSEDAEGYVTDFGRTLAEHGGPVLVVRLGATGGGRVAPLQPIPAEPWQRAVEPVRGVPGLHRLSAPVATDLTALLTRARESFDHVLVTAPPLTRSGEALRALPAVDAVLLFVRPQRTTVEDLRAAAGLLQRTRGEIEGLVVLTGRRAVRGRAPEAPVPAEVPARTARAELEGRPERSG